MQNVTTRSLKTFESRALAHTSHASLIEDIKNKAAVLLDALNEISIPPENKEVPRLVALAKTELESSVMWATKAISRFSS